MGWIAFVAKHHSINGLDEAVYLQRLAAALGPDWEVKILHSASNQFADPVHVRDALFQESDADWELVEQIDAGRLVFRRSLRAHRRDHLLPPGYNPYREHYQTRPWFTPAIGGALLLIGLLIALAIMSPTP